MKKLYSHFKSLSLLLLCSTAIAQCMEPQEDKPITWAQTYHGLSKFLIKDVMPLIFSFHLDSSGIDYANLPALIKQSCTGPEAFVNSIDTLLKPENHTLVAEIFERAFAHEKISICDIKNAGYGWNVLHEASWNQRLEAVKFILNIAGDKTWTLLTTKSQNGWTALHTAAYNNHLDVVKLLLNAAGNNAQEFMDIQNCEKKTAFYYAATETKEVMKKYRKNNQ